MQPETRGKPLIEILFAGDDPTMPDTFGARLKARREAAGLSLRSLAAAAGLSHQAVHRFESGLAEPVFSTACRLATALRCKLDDLCPRP